MARENTPMALPIRLTIIDDHNIVVEGLSLMFQNEDGFDVVAEGHTAADAIAIAKLYTFDIMLMDLNLPDRQGLEAAKEILSLYPDKYIIALTMNESTNTVRECIEAGLRGYILKNTVKDDLLLAVQAAVNGEIVLPNGMTLESIKEDDPSISSTEIGRLLTKREKQVLARILQEETTQEIAETLGLSPLTVETHRKNILHKLNVKNTAGLVKLAVSSGFTQ